MPSVIVTHPEGLPTLAAPPSTAAREYDAGADGGVELDRQVQAYIELGFPELLGLDEVAFRAMLEPLRDLVADLHLDARDGDVPADDHIPFVVVLDHFAQRPNDVVPAMRRGTERGVSVIDDEEISTYRTIGEVELPTGPAYLLGGVDVGTRYVNVTPEDALTSVLAAGRSPLTVAEGLAVVTLRPDMLRPNRCFSLAASRTGTNQRVPAIWISERRPKLGWCWDRNPHTWLGTASAGYRRAVPA